MNVKILIALALSSYSLLGHCTPPDILSGFQRVKLTTVNTANRTYSNPTDKPLPKGQFYFKFKHHICFNQLNNNLIMKKVSSISQGSTRSNINPILYTNHGETIYCYEGHHNS